MIRFFLAPGITLVGLFTTGLGIFGGFPAPWLSFVVGILGFAVVMISIEIHRIGWRQRW